jgi:hypothetical protein
MNRINPIYIVVLLTILLSLLIYKLGTSKSELEENKESFKTTQAIALNLVSLKDVYADNIKIKQSLQRILNDTSLRSAGLKTKFKTTALSISAQSVDLKTLNLLLNKILNGAYVIESMKIKSVSSTKADLQMEIRW